MNFATLVQNANKAVCILHYINILKKGTNTDILLSAKVK